MQTPQNPSPWEIVKTFENQNLVLQLKSNGKRYSFMAGYKKSDGTITPHIAINKVNQDFGLAFSSLFTQMQEYLIASPYPKSKGAEVGHADDAPVQPPIKKSNRDAKKAVPLTEGQDFPKSNGYKSIRKGKFNWRTLDLND